MKSSRLSGRERVKRALERRDHDRVPRSEHVWPETMERWKREGLTGDEEFAERLRDDFAGLCWSWPVPFPGRHEVLEETAETQVVRDSMGKIERHWKHRSGTPEHIEFGCDCRSQWERVYKPALRAAGISVEPADAREKHAKASRAGKWCHFAGIESFEAMRQLVGDVILLTAMADEPEWVLDMSRTYTDLILRDFDAIRSTGVEPDGVWVFGDIGYNHGPFFSPRMYEQLLQADHRRIGAWAHEHSGMYIYHTDGDVRSLIAGLLKANIDGLQPMEAKAGMDVRKLAPQYGDRLTFFGNIDMTVALTNDRSRVEHEVRSKLEAGMASLGYIFHSDHSVPPQVSWPTYRHVLELVDRYGNYA